ncbi:MAG: hypothetical protein OHK0052_15140 [Anaerolineales bacterium]
MYDVFISYAKEDAPWVEGYLLDAFEQGGINYHDEEAFALGVPRLIEFERAIKQSKRTLLILTPAYMADTFTQFVDVLVQSYGLETATWPVIPLVLKAVDLPPRLAQLTALDATVPENWQRCLERLCETLGMPLPEAAALPDCPYPGMVPFKESDSNRFYGRDAEIEEILEALRLHPFLTVIGPSGSGKSSLVFAGVLPKLRKSKRFGKGEWQVDVMRPGETPLQALQALKLNDTQTVRRLLIVDQFEETFTTSRAEAEPFQAALLALIGLPNLYVLLTVRADFYSDLMASPMWTQIQAHRMEVRPLKEENLRQIIVRPAEDVGVFIESALVERLLADAAGEPGALPLIQETLVLLWERVERRFLPFRAYEALVMTRGAYGSSERTGLQVAIARRADAAYNSLTPDEQVICRRIFLRLIQFGEGRADTRRQQPLAALRAAHDNPEAFKTVLRVFTDNRMLTLSADTTDRRVDISHEALINGWSLLREWIESRRESEQVRRRIENKAAEWVRLGRGEGGLLDDVELLEVRRWLESADSQDMGASEEILALVQASQAALDAAALAKEAAYQRELQQARALAEEQERRAEAEKLRAEEQAAAAEKQRIAAQRLRQLLYALIFVALVAAGAAIYAVIQENVAQQNAQIAQQNEATAIAAQSTSDVRRVQAEDARATAVAEANVRATAQAETEAQRKIAEKNAILAQSRELAAQAQNALIQGQPQLALLLAVEAIRIPEKIGETRPASAEQALRETLANIGGIALNGHENVIWQMTISPDGHYLATASFDGTARVWNLQAANPGQNPLVLRGHEKLLRDVAFSPDSRYLATSSDDTTVRLWDLQAQNPAENPLVLRGHTAQVRAVLFSPAGRYLASASDDATIRLWDLQSANPAENPQILSGHSRVVWQLAFSPDGHYLASGSLDTTIRLWDMQAENPAESSRVLSGHTGFIADVEFSPNGRLLASAGFDGTARIWNLAYPENSPEFQTVLLGHENVIRSLAFSPDGNWLATASQDTTIRLWAVASDDIQRDVLILRNHKELVWRVLFTPDSRTLVSAGFDNTLHLWDMTDPDPAARPRVLSGHDSDVQAIAISKDGVYLASGDYNGSARLWNMRQLSLGVSPLALTDFRVKIQPNANIQLQAMAISPNSRWLAAISGDDTVRLWDIQHPETTPRQINYAGGVNAVQFSPDGRYLAAAGEDGTLKIWDLSPLAVGPLSLQAHNGAALVLAFSPNSRYLVSGGKDGRVLLWNFEALMRGSQAAPQPLGSHADWVTRLAFSPDGLLLASAAGGDPSDNRTTDTQAYLWQVPALANGDFAPLALQGHTDRIADLVFSADSRYLATASFDLTVRLWQVQTADPNMNVLALNGHTQAVLSVAFSPTGDYLASAGRDTTVMLWSMTNPATTQENAEKLTGHDDWVRQVAFNQKGNLALSVSNDYSLRLWDLTTDTLSVISLRSHRGIIRNLLVSPDNRWAITLGEDGAIRLWHLNAEELIETACLAAGRDLSTAEQELYLHQADGHLTCPNLAAP